MNSCETAAPVESAVTDPRCPRPVHPLQTLLDHSEQYLAHSLPRDRQWNIAICNDVAIEVQRRLDQHRLRKVGAPPDLEIPLPHYPPADTGPDCRQETWHVIDFGHDVG